MRIVKLIIILSLGITFPAMADNVQVKNVLLVKVGDIWHAEVTLFHKDSGFAHYVYQFRIVTEKGDILASRLLYYPHVRQQTFTRALDNIRIPESVNTVYVEAYDKVHGWSPERIKVDLTTDEGERYRIERYKSDRE